MDIDVKNSSDPHELLHRINPLHREKEASHREQMERQMDGRRSIGPIDRRNNYTIMHVIPLDDEAMLDDERAMHADRHTGEINQTELEWIAERNCDQARLIIDTINIDNEWQRTHLATWLKRIADQIERGEPYPTGDGYAQYVTYRFVHFYRNLYELWVEK